MDKKALVDRHLSLVRALAAGMVAKLPPTIDMEDMLGYGHEGLLEAAERFDPTRGVTFATFAYYRIRGAMYDGLREAGGLPREVVARFRLAEKADAYLENAVAREAGTDAAARGRPTTADTLRELSGHVSGLTAIYMTSIDAAEERGLADERVEEQRERLETSWLTPRLKEAIGQLSEREQKLIELCYYQERSLKEAGEFFGFTKSWASRLHARAVRKLQRVMAAGP